MSSIDEVLDIDLNDVVSKAIRKQIKQLQKQVADQGKKLYNQSQEIQDLKAKAKVDDAAKEIVESLCKRYAATTATKETSNAYERSALHNQYLMVRDVVKLAYGKILPEDLTSRREVFNSIVWACKDHKKEVCSVLLVMDANGTKQLRDSISGFHTPETYSKGAILQFLRKPHRGYNGDHLRCLHHWIGERFSFDYCPYEMLLANPACVQDDVFAIMIESIKAKVQYSEDFFGMPLYNNAATDQQIKTLGSLAAQLTTKQLSKDTEAGTFVAKFMSKFNKEDIDLLFERINMTSTAWSTMYYGIFPVEYQMKAFRKMTFKALKELVQNYSSRYSPEHQELIYADWFYHNPHPHTPKESAV